MTTVWVVEGFDYDQYGNYGIYESPQGAKKAFPAEDWELRHGNPDYWYSPKMQLGITPQEVVPDTPL